MSLLWSHTPISTNDRPVEWCYNNNNNNKSIKITIQCRIVTPLFVGMLKLHGFCVATEREGKKRYLSEVIKIESI